MMMVALVLTLLLVVVASLVIYILYRLSIQKIEILTQSLMAKSTEQIIQFNQQHQDVMVKMQQGDLKEREGLRERLNQMMVSAQSIEKEAHQLSQALKSDVKFQGAWGEFTLERILELTGLEKDREFFVQQTRFGDDQQIMRPDVIIVLPGGGTLVIDAKVSLKAYFDYCQEASEHSLKELKVSVSTHIDKLSQKKYFTLDGMNSPDFIYLFIPVEGVYNLILQNFPIIIEESLKKNIILVSPVNLMANLKTVAMLWRIEKQNENAQHLAQKAGDMHDKFAALCGDLEKIQSQLQKTQQSFDDVLKKLSQGRGNLVGRAKELKDLGANTHREIPLSHDLT